MWINSRGNSSLLVSAINFGALTGSISLARAADPVRARVGLQFLNLVSGGFPNGEDSSLYRERMVSRPSRGLGSIRGWVAQQTLQSEIMASNSLCWSSCQVSEHTLLFIFQFQTFNNHFGPSEVCTLERWFLSVKYPPQMEA